MNIDLHVLLKMGVALKNVIVKFKKTDSEFC